MHTAATDKTRRLSPFISHCILRAHDKDCKCVGGVTSKLVALPPFHQIKVYLAKISLKQQVVANKSLWLEDLKCYLSLCQVSGTDSVVYEKSLNVSEQTCNVYWSKV